MKASTRALWPLLLIAAAGCDGGGSDTTDELGSRGRDGSVDGSSSDIDGGDTTDGEGGLDGGADGDSGSVVSPAAWVDCDDRSVSTATAVTASIGEDETWAGTILLQGNIQVRGAATLTIQPGTIIVMDSDSSLEIGWNGGASRILAAGTAEAPIRFCGRAAEAGYHQGVTIGTNVLSDSVMRNVLIADGGGNNEAALTLNADVTVDQVQVRNSGADGVWASDFTAASAALSVQGAAKNPVVLTDAGGVTNFPLGGAFEGNGEEAIRIRFAAISEATTYHDVGIPYLQERPLDVRMANVTFEAGVDYMFEADAHLEFGWNSNAMRLLIEGTADNPVVMRGKADASGYFQGLVVQRNVLTDSRISYLTVKNAGGGDTWALDLQAAITLDHVTLQGNSKGMYVSGAGLRPESTDVTITGTTGAPLTLDPNGLPTLPRGAYTGNTDDRIAIVGTTLNVSGTVKNLGVPYLVTTNIDVRASTGATTRVTIEPGTVFEVGADSEIEFGWNSSQGELTAVGTAAAPIVFRGTADVAGLWKGIILRQNVLTTSRLDYVQILNAGQDPAPGGAALLAIAQIPVTNSTIAKTIGYGIRKPTANTLDYAATNTFTEIGAPANILTY